MTVRAGPALMLGRLPALGMLCRRASLGIQQDLARISVPLRPDDTSSPSSMRSFGITGRAK